MIFFWTGCQHKYLIHNHYNTVRIQIIKIQLICIIISITQLLQLFEFQPRKLLVALNLVEHHLFVELVFIEVGTDVELVLDGFSSKGCSDVSSFAWQQTFCCNKQALASRSKKHLALIAFGTFTFRELGAKATSFAARSTLRTIFGGMLGLDCRGNVAKIISY